MENLWLCHVFLLFLTCCLMSSSLASEVINRTVGEDCVLEISVPKGRVIFLEWTKAGADVFFYRNGKLENQDDPYTGRVLYEKKTLAENNGTLSVTLKNVRLEDSGNFTCRTFIQISRTKKEVRDKTLQLTVIESPDAHHGVNEARKDQREEDMSDNQGSLDTVNNITNGRNSSAVVGAIFGALAIFAAMVSIVYNRKRIKDWIKTLKKSSVKSDIPTEALNPAPSSKHHLVA